jgi:hypothetical protein
MVTKTALSSTIVNFRNGTIANGFETRPVNAQGSDETANLVNNADGTVSILCPDGSFWLSIQPDGTWEGRPGTAPPGPWESFTRVGNVLTELAKDGVSRPLVQFIARDL